MVMTVVMAMMTTVMTMTMTMTMPVMVTMTMIMMIVTMRRRRNNDDRHKAQSQSECMHSTCGAWKKPEITSTKPAKTGTSANSSPYVKNHNKTAKREETKRLADVPILCQFSDIE